MGVASARTAMSAVTLAVTVAIAPPGLAQGITPGGVQDTLKRPPELKPVPPPQAPLSKPAGRPASQATTPAKNITVTHFEFAGNTLFSSEELNGLVTSYTQRPITLIELYEAADLVTDFYVRRGFTLASAVVPAQKVTDGTVRLEVIEGRIGTIQYEGLKRYAPRTLDYFLDTAGGRVYESAVFEQNLRTVDGLPGLDVRARLQPGAEYGTSDIVVLAKETPFEGSAFVDNGGTKSIGVIRTGVQATINSPFGAADQLSLTALRSENALLKYGAATYSLPTGVGASRINLTYGHAEFDVAGAFAGISGSNSTARAELFAPVFDTGNSQLSMLAAVNSTQANTDFSGVTFNKTEVSVFEVGGNYTRSYASRAVTQFTGLIGSNFTDYNATTDSASQPLKIDLDLQQLTPLPYELQLLTRTQFVYGIDPLPDTQKFSVGGPSTVRGYAPSEARGDWGYLAQITLRRSFLLSGAVVAPRLFYDAASVRQHQSDRFPLGSRPQDVSLASYGFGASISLLNLSASLDYAMPTTSKPVSDGKEDGRFYGSFSFSF